MRGGPAVCIWLAAGCVLPLVSTVVRPNAEGFLEESLDRSQYMASQTPQAFRLAVLQQAYAGCSVHELDHGTECLQLALRYGGARAKLIAGPPTLWKVTYVRPACPPVRVADHTGEAQADFQPAPAAGTSRICTRRSRWSRSASDRWRWSPVAGAA